MIFGAHVIVYSKNAAADRAFLSEALRMRRRIAPSSLRPWAFHPWMRGTDG